MHRAFLPFLLLPIACAQPDPADPGAVLQDALASHQASIAGIAPRAPGAGAAADTLPPAPRAAGAAAPDSTTPPAMAGQLVGQAPETVTRWLGPPRLRRAEGGAEVWHYSATQCHLDLVLYQEEGPQPQLRVAYASARAVGTARRGEAACLRDIARGATLRPSQGGFYGSAG